MRLIQIATPSAEPITTAEAKAHLRVSGSDEDALIVGYLIAAREWVENATGRALLPQDWELRLDEWPEGYEIELPRPPLISVTHIKTADASGTLTTLDADTYQAVMGSGPTAEPAIICPAAAGEWPTLVDGVRDAVLIQYRAGYVSASAVPAALKSAIYLALGDLYANREAANAAKIAANPAFDRLIAPYRQLWI